MISIDNYKNVKFANNVKNLKYLIDFYYALIYNRLNNKENKQNNIKANN